MMNQLSEHSKIPMLVVIFLGIIGILLSVGVIVLTYYDKKIDGGLFTLAGGAVGALGALLTNTRGQSQRQNDQPVKVETEPGKPLETTPVPAPDASTPDSSEEPEDEEVPQAPRPSDLSRMVMKP